MIWECNDNAIYNGSIGNSFYHCMGIDLGTGGYFLTVVPPFDAAVYHYSSCFVECMGPQYMDPTMELWGCAFPGRHPTDMMGTAPSGGGPPMQENYRICPALAGADQQVMIETTKASADMTGLEIKKESWWSFVSLKALTSNYELRIQTNEFVGGTLYPLLFTIYQSGLLKELARMDIDNNFKFTTLVLPSAAPWTAVAGSCYFDVGSLELRIYDGANWKKTVLGA
jgi:hypothetical protein